MKQRSRKGRLHNPARWRRRSFRSNPACRPTRQVHPADEKGVEMEPMHWIAHGVFLADLVTGVGLTVRVMGRRLRLAPCRACLLTLLVSPLVGAALSLVIGESRRGPRRARRILAYRDSRGGRPSKTLPAD